MRKLHELPDDIILAIIQECDIDAVLTLRLTCSNLCITIATYINAIAPTVGRNTFPECEELLTPPKEYSVKWLKGLIPRQLASIVLDKDKLNRSRYNDEGYPLGIPSENACTEARYWRGRIATGWRVLQALHLISRRVYSLTRKDIRKIGKSRGLSGYMGQNHIWQAITCPDSDCVEHPTKNITSYFARKEVKSNADIRPVKVTARFKTDRNLFPDFHWREDIILEDRLALIDQLPIEDLISYTYLWRILHMVFRPYDRPDYIYHRGMEGRTCADKDWTRFAKGGRVDFQKMIEDTEHGYSWLNWFVLHVGSSPFLQQWSVCHPSSTPNEPPGVRDNIVRDDTWKTYISHTSHQVELECANACKVEYALRSRCISPEERKRAEADMFTRDYKLPAINLRYIPCAYDIYDLPGYRPTYTNDFPWYQGTKCLWMNSKYYLWLRPTILHFFVRPTHRDLEWREGDTREFVVEGDDGSLPSKGPLEHVPYLVYLGKWCRPMTWNRDDEEFIL